MIKKIIIGLGSIVILALLIFVVWVNNVFDGEMESKGNIIVKDLIAKNIVDDTRKWEYCYIRNWTALMKYPKDKLKIISNYSRFSRSTRRSIKSVLAGKKIMDGGFDYLKYEKEGNVIAQELLEKGLLDNSSTDDFLTIYDFPRLMQESRDTLRTLCRSTKLKIKTKDFIYKEANKKYGNE